MPAALAGPPDARPSRILGVGAYRPTRVVTNDEICRTIDSSDAWIRARSGIATRRFAEPDETIDVMAGIAGTKALAEAGVEPADVGCVIVASMSYLLQAPPASAAVAARVGAPTAAALDVSAGCAGFCYALALARDLVSAGSARHVLVVGSERMSDIVDPYDRGTAFIFGDGAGAVVVGPADSAGIGPVVWGSDTTHLDAIRQDAPWRGATGGEADAPPPYLRMAGQEVFRWAIRGMADVARAALRASGVGPDELTAFIPHQANMRITDAVAKALDLPAHVVVARAVADNGNTSGASIPLAMDALLSSHACESGNLALLLGFGSGMLYAAQVVRLP